MKSTEKIIETINPEFKDIHMACRVIQHIDRLMPMLSEEDSYNFKLLAHQWMNNFKQHKEELY